MNISKRDVAIAVVSCIVGVVGGVGFIASTKTAQLADDVHQVKEDYDKGKHRVAEDYVHAADVMREAVDNVDTAEIGSATTTGIKKLGREAADGSREVGSKLKQRLLEKLEQRRAAHLQSQKAATEKAIKSQDEEFDELQKEDAHH